MWGVISDIMGLSVFSDFETMATWWLKGKRYNPVNVFSSAVLGLEEKKQLVFSGRAGQEWWMWWEVVLRLLKNWKLVNNQDET
jgi:hypothetical protein